MRNPFKSGRTGVVAGAKSHGAASAVPAPTHRTPRMNTARPNYAQIISRNGPRITQTVNPRTLGPTFHTADQADQRIYLGSGYDGKNAFNADPSQRPLMGSDATNDTPGFANVTRTTRHPDGTCDAVRLEATQDGWIDLGGPTPTDFKVVNW